MKRLIFFLAAAALAVAQSRIEGRVLAPDGSPIPQATVIATIRSTAYIEETAQDGSYRFTLPAGKYSVGTEKHGYRTAKGYYSPKEVTLGEEPLKDFDFELRPLGVLSGVVLDANSDPVPDIAVSLLQSYVANGTTRISGRFSATTDDRGRFRIILVEPGSYFLKAGYEPILSVGDRRGPPLKEIRGASAQVQDIPVFYPDATDVANAKPIEVSYTPIEGLVLHMPRIRTFKIDARGTGAPPGEVSTVLVLTPDGENRVFENQEGRLPPGRYVLVARAGNYRNPSMFGMREVVLTDHDLTGVEVPLLPTVRLTGKVTDAAGKPVQGSFQLTLVDLASSLLDPDSVQVSPEGTFTTPNLGRLTYKVGPLNSAPITSVRLNGKEIPGGVVDLRDGVAGILEIQLGK
jgi:hypothetical protein